MAEDGWLSAEAFSSACAVLPLVSIDLFITGLGEHGPEILLGHRNNPPAQDWWFTPGGRIRKNEPLAQAMERIAREEVGPALLPLSDVELVGAWDHFYPDSAFDSSVSTHYVNLAYHLCLPKGAAAHLVPAQGEGVQHRAWQWMPLSTAVADPDVHENVRPVVRRLLELAGGIET